MPQDYQRTDRIADVIQRELAQLIQYEVKDPRLTTMVTVAGVKVTRDLSYAKVYIMVLAEDKERQLTLEILNHAASYLRSQLSKRLDLRTVPKLTFIYDDTLQTGNRMTDLIDTAMKRSTEPDNNDDND